MAKKNEIVKATKKCLEKINALEDIHRLWFVTFRQVSPGTFEDPVANGRFFIANSVEDALQKFADWSNARHMSTADVYAVAVSDVVNRQKAEISQRGYSIDYGTQL